MYKLIAHDGETVYGIKQFAVDSMEDISALPHNCPMGSTVIVIPTGQVFMVNGEGKWQEIGGNTVI